MSKINNKGLTSDPDLRLDSAGNDNPNAETPALAGQQVGTNQSSPKVVPLNGVKGQATGLMAKEKMGFEPPTKKKI
jgi:hypothetical protein